MRKEIILAVIMGLSLGLFITYGVYTARNSLSQPKVSASPTPSANLDTTQVDSTLVIHSPEDERIQTEKSVLVSGNTIAGSLVVVLLDDQEHITTADNTGAFSRQLTLKGGANLISIHALDQNGQLTTVERTVIVADASLEAASSSTSSANTSPSPTPKASSSPKISPKPSPKP